MSKNTKRAVVIGSGIGGIGSALRLKAKGYDVDVFEAMPFLGGKLAELKLGDYRFDMGPSLFTMPNLVTELFELFNETPSKYFNYERLNPICQYFWDDGTELTANAQREEFFKAFAGQFPEDAKGIRKYIADVKTRYKLTAPTFLEKSIHKSSTWLSKELLAAIIQLHKLGAHHTLDSLNRSYFKNPKAVQLFNRYATYNGSSPYLTPGVMSVIPYLEYFQGAFFPTKGMRSIPLSLVELGKRHGVNFYTNSQVSKIIIENKKATGIVVNNQKKYYDLVVSDMDIVPTYRKLMSEQKQPEKILTAPRSASALIFYWGIKREFNNLGVHNIFFSNNYQEEFKYMFKTKEMYHDPTVYVHISNKSTGIDCPQGKENWFVMITCCGHKGQQESEEWIAQNRNYIIQKLNRVLGVEVNNIIEEESVLTPYMIEERTSSYQGALYGAASNSSMAALARHPNFSQKIKNLYFCGGSVHPGGGIPLSLSSAKIIDGLIPKA